MNRRAFVTSLGAVLAAPLGAEAQPERSKPRIAVLFNAIPIAEISGPNPKESSMRAFLEGMRAHGWIDGQNITIERRSAEGHVDRYLPLAQEMVNLKVEVLVISGATPFVLAAQQATRTIPIVMAGLEVALERRGIADEHGVPEAVHEGMEPDGVAGAFNADGDRAGQSGVELFDGASLVAQLTLIHFAGLGVQSGQRPPVASACGDRSQRVS
jgi:hypothetical protein